MAAVQQPKGIVVIKKYSNRRLYDTGESRYVTLDELAEKIRSGFDVRVVDAKSNADLTQPTLAQIILESRRAARLLPSSLLLQLIRMDDDTLAEFFGNWLSWALEVYRFGRQGAQAIAPINPFATLPFTATNAIARMFSQGQAPWGQQQSTPPPPPPFTEETPPPPDDEEQEAPAVADQRGDDIAELRAEIAALKDALLAGRKD